MRLLQISQQLVYPFRRGLQQRSQLAGAAVQGIESRRGGGQGRLQFLPSGSQRIQYPLQKIDIPSGVGDELLQSGKQAAVQQLLHLVQQVAALVQQTADIAAGDVDRGHQRPESVQLLLEPGQGPGGGPADQAPFGQKLGQSLQPQRQGIRLGQ